MKHKNNKKAHERRKQHGYKVIGNKIDFLKMIHTLTFIALLSKAKQKFFAMSAEGRLTEEPGTKLMLVHQMNLSLLHSTFAHHGIVLLLEFHSSANI